MIKGLEEGVELIFKKKNVSCKLNSRNSVFSPYF